jgi:amino acid transporter
MPSRKRSPGKLRALHLAAVIFFTVSGGPYGLEPLFYYANHGALLLLFITPLLWDVPTILTVLELNSLMPITGGYYQWVKRALGIRWAFFEGWWTWLYTFCDLAIYPVLFVGYASYFLPEIAAYKIPVCLAIIWSSALLNIIGIVPVGRTSMALSIIVLVPFLFMFGLACIHPAAHPTPPSAANPTGFPALSLGLYTVMWNFIGWDNATTYAGEVDRPIRSYLVSVCGAFLTTITIYALAALAVNRSGIDPGALKDGGFPLLGQLVGGRWLGMLIAAGGMASTLGLYSAVLLSVSRVPQVMGEDKLLPSAFCTLHARFKTPYISIITSSLVVSVLVLFTFSDLIIMDIILYGAGLSLEFLALLILRRKEPGIRRPFRIPLGKSGLILLFLLPVVIYTVALTGAIQSSEKIGLPLYLSIGMLFSPAIIWRFIRRRPHLAGSRGLH